MFIITAGWQALCLQLQGLRPVLGKEEKGENPAHPPREQWWEWESSGGTESRVIQSWGWALTVGMEASFGRALPREELALFGVAAATMPP